MFGLFKTENLEDSFDKELSEQILALWTCHHQLANAVQQLSELMGKLTEASLIAKNELDFIAQQTLRISDQQNKLLAHVMRSDDMMNDDMESKSLH